MKKKPDGLISKIHVFFNRGMWSVEPDAFSGIRLAGVKFLRICSLVFKGFQDDKCPIHASALTFISVMALVPFLVILFAIAKGLGFEKASEMIIQRTSEMPEAFQQAVVNIIETVEAASAGTLGSIGTLLFLWIAIKMLSNIEETFNVVWGVKDSRTLIDKVRNYIVIMVIAPILLIVSTSSQPILMGFASKLEWMGPLLKLGLQSVPLLVIASGFSVVYMFLPNTKVKLISAFNGGLVAALLTMAFQFAIIKLGVGVSRYNATYGALAAIPIFLFWVQMSWMILLMGAEVAFSTQNAGTYASERFAINPSARARLCLAIALMKRITDSFNSSDTPFDTTTYGTEHRIPIRLINDVVSVLTKAGLISESAEHPACYTLLRDPRNISARDITDAILDDGATAIELGLTSDIPLFGKITDESFQTLEKEILKNF